MKWSRYSHLFQSRRNGWLLYNSASNSFLQLEDQLAERVKEIAKNPDEFDFSAMPQIYLLLRSNGYLVEERQDDDLYNILKMRRLKRNYNPGVLRLTIAVTKACNFDCSYCFEGNRTGQPMSVQVEEQLLRFIEMHKKLDRLVIVWYGGEPLLAFDRMLSINEKLKKIGKKYTSGIITNGYLLRENVIEKLNDLNVGFIQITLDGSAKTHNSRRYLKNGGETFDTILSNLDRLMASDYQGTVSIRVNVDSRNEEEFAEVYRLIEERYGELFGKKIFVYPGFVKGDGHPDVSCFFDSGEKGRFLAKMAKEHGIKALSLFPKTPPTGCTLTMSDAYVVGPEGELYKCWDDVGMKDMVVGNINSFTDWNMGLIAEGMVACSYLDSPECKECFYFPVCDGGCHKARQKNLHDDLNRDSCSHFKGNLEELLELYYEQKKAEKA